MKTSTLIMLALTVLRLTIGTVGQAEAGAMLVTSRAALSPNDSIDWGQLGPDFTIVPNSDAVTSANGLAATISTSDSGGFARVDEGTSWLGNFALYDHLLENNSFNYFPTTLTFSSPVSGAGAQIQPDFTADPSGAFTATIEAFSGNVSLGVFTEDGISTSSEDGSAIFIGIADTKAEITSIVFGIKTVAPGYPGNFAINEISLNTLTASVPETSSILMATMAIAFGISLALYKRIN